MKKPKYRAYIKLIGWIVPVDSIDFLHEDILVDLADGQGADAEYRFDEIELMQWTGMKDKNGVEIYVGDKIKNEKGQWEGTIVLENGAFRVLRKVNGIWKLWVLEDQRAKKVEVIGNIYTG